MPFPFHFFPSTVKNVTGCTVVIFPNRFYICDVKLEVQYDQFICFTPAVKEPVAGPSACEQLRQLQKEALQILLDDGVVYRKRKSQDEVYHVRSLVGPISLDSLSAYCVCLVHCQVTVQDKDLIIAVKDIIREDSRREKCNYSF